MEISSVGINLIKEFEGCYLKAYKCPAGVWTIGYGTTEYINGVKPHEGMTITQSQADELLKKNLKTYEATVNAVTRVPLNQNQFDALVSFTYNCGCGAYKTSTLLKLLNKGDYLGAADQLPLWNKGGGKVLNGLIRRRAAEKELFITPIKLTIVEDTELSKAVSNIIHSSININFNQWKRKDLIKLINVPSLLTKLGGLDKLVADNVISDKQLWSTEQYNANHVRSLLIKYADRI